MRSKFPSVLAMTLATSAASDALAKTPTIAVRGTVLYGEAYVEPGQTPTAGSWLVGQIAAYQRWWAVETDLRVFFVKAWFQSLHGGLRVPILGEAGTPGFGLALNLMRGIVGGVNETYDDAYQQREVVFGPQGLLALDIVFRPDDRVGYSFRLYGDYQHWAVNNPTHYGWRVDPYGEHYEPTRHRLYVGLMLGVEFSGR